MNWKFYIKIFLIIVTLHIGVKTIGYMYKSQIIQNITIPDRDIGSSDVKSTMPVEKSGEMPQDEYARIPNDLQKLESYNTDPTSGETANITIYYHKNTLTIVDDAFTQGLLNTTGPIVRSWFLLNQDRKINGTKSYKYYIEFDCKNKTSRALLSEEYPGAFGAGTVKTSYDGRYDRHEYVSPNSSMSVMMKYACSFNKLDLR